MLQVLGQIEEGVEEQSAEVALLQIGQLNPIGQHGLHHIEALAQTVLQRRRLDAHLLHTGRLLRIELVQLVQGENSVAVHVHASEPVLDAAWSANSNR